MRHRRERSWLLSHVSYELTNIDNETGIMMLTKAREDFIMFSICKGEKTEEKPAKREKERKKEEEQKITMYERKQVSRNYNVHFSWC